MHCTASANGPKVYGRIQHRMLEEESHDFILGDPLDLSPHGESIASEPNLLRAESDV